MKFYLPFFICFCFYTNVLAQKNISQNSTCTCILSINLKSPDYSDEDSVTAKVIVEIDIDSNCHYSNPVIIQSASVGRNKAALDYARQFIREMNKCNCPSNPHCTKGKTELPLIFVAEREE